MDDSRVSMTTVTVPLGAEAVEFRRTGAISDSGSDTTDGESQQLDGDHLPGPKHDKVNTRSSAITAAPVLPKATPKS